VSALAKKCAKKCATTGKEPCQVVRFFIVHLEGKKDRKISFFLAEAENICNNRVKFVQKFCFATPRQSFANVNKRKKLWQLV
jgi:hypothetical protein